MHARRAILRAPSRGRQTCAVAHLTPTATDGNRSVSLAVTGIVSPLLSEGRSPRYTHMSPSAGVSMREQPSEAFGPYLIYEKLGSGGMAIVHRAKKRGIEGVENPVALKRLLPELAVNDEFVRAF